MRSRQVDKRLLPQRTNWRTSCLSPMRCYLKLRTRDPASPPLWARDPHLHARWTLKTAPHPSPLPGMSLQMSPRRGRSAKSNYLLCITLTTTNRHPQQRFPPHTATSAATTTSPRPNYHRSHSTFPTLFPSCHIALHTASHTLTPMVIHISSSISSDINVLLVTQLLPLLPLLHLPLRCTPHKHNTCTTCELVSLYSTRMVTAGRSTLLTAARRQRRHALPFLPWICRRCRQ